MEFWGVEVKPGETVKCEPGDGKYLHISLASLGESMSKRYESVPIFVKVNYQKLVIGTLSADKCAQISYTLVFEKEFELYHASKSASVYFCGCKSAAQEYKYPLDNRLNSEEDVPVDQNANGGESDDEDVPVDDNLNDSNSDSEDVPVNQNANDSAFNSEEVVPVDQSANGREPDSTQDVPVNPVYQIANVMDSGSDSEEDILVDQKANAATYPRLTSQDFKASLLRGFDVAKTVKFSYKELVKATKGFSKDNIIGQGGFGVVYYGKLRGQKAAIKKLNSTWGFHAELNVLANVHHLNLVHLIGYCTEDFCALVYEFLENGKLSEHLFRPDRDSLEWSTRVQIALDSARGLEYIHEHTVPLYIHHDIRSLNIMLDKEFHAKIIAFGLTELYQAGGPLMEVPPAGTFGYAAPEQIMYGELSPKNDVYGFGVVLYELISAKQARCSDAVFYDLISEEQTCPNDLTYGLVSLFENVLSRPDPREHLSKVVDPRLGDNYPGDSIFKMALLAKACTRENPKLRPSMRSVVVALMALSSETEEWENWDIGFRIANSVVDLRNGW